MSRLALLSLGLLLTASSVYAHCQVPCGIYGDQRRFEQMLEDAETVAKSQKSVGDLVGGEIDAQAVNQMSRWVATKEDHAGRIQHTIADYFLAQRIKTDDPKYVEKLKAAHAVIIAAMKAKQSADSATAAALETAILDFYRAYEGKEPKFEIAH